MAKKIVKNTEKAPTKKQLANLHRPWKKGESGNPGGKKPGTVDLITQLRNYIADHPEETKEMIANFVRRSGKSSYDLEKLLDRVHGKVPQKVVQAGSIGVKIDGATEALAKIYNAKK